MSEQNEENSLRAEIATLQQRHHALDKRVVRVEKCVDDFPRDLKDKHAENRKSIHDLRDGQQTIIDLVHKVDLKLARQAGYAMGAGAAVGVFVELLHYFLKTN